MRNKRNVGLVLAVVMLFSCFNFNVYAAQETADVLYVNGSIYTVDANFSKASIIATKGDRIVYVGTDMDEAAKFQGSSTKVVDLNGKTVIPGLIESHIHFLGTGEKLQRLDLFWKPKDVILNLVKAEAERLADGEWVDGRGWNQEVWADNSWPSKEDLDAVAPNNPVILTRTDSHAIWVNSKAIELAGVTKDTPDPQGGEILKNSDGEVLGIFTDLAMPLIREQVPPNTPERKYEAFVMAQKEMFSLGLTSFADCGLAVDDVDIVKSGYEKGDLKIRAYEFIRVYTDEDVAYSAAGNEPFTGMYGDRLSINGVKVTSDGSLGSRSAFLLDEYADRPGHSGNGRFTDEELYTLMKRVSDKGFQLTIHAIGDGAVNQVLNVYEKIFAEKPKPDHRFRIEHFQICAPEDIPRAVNMGVIPSMQAVHATSDMNMAEDRVGSERIKSSYAWRTVIDDGGIILNGSDSPVELINPYHGLFAGVARTDRFGNPIGGWYPELAMTREENLKSFTIWGAHGMFEEKNKGSLEVGKLADFVVLDRDIMTCNIADVRETQALMTVLGGEVVYQNAAADASITFMGAKVECGKDYLNIDDRLYVPADALVGAMEVVSEFDKDENAITITYKDKKLVLKAGSTDASYGGVESVLSVAPVFENGKLYIPVRAVGEALSLKVNWYKDGKAANISY